MAGALRISQLAKSYETREGLFGRRRLEVFAALDITIAGGQFVTILGPSGCGKSTVLNIVAGFEQASMGTVEIDGRPVNGPGLDRGVVFQDFALFPWLSVLGNVGFGLRSKGMPQAQRLETARRYTEMVGLAAFGGYYPKQLSGGMRQRVGLARALAVEPVMLLMDEPFGALDSLTRETMQGVLNDAWQLTRKTVLFITHDIREAIYLSDRVLVLNGRPSQVALDIEVDLPRPRDRHTAAFQALEVQLEAALRGGA